MLYEVITVAFIYEKKYESTRNAAFLEKAIRYWVMLLDSKDVITSYSIHYTKLYDTLL